TAAEPAVRCVCRTQPPRPRVHTVITWPAAGATVTMTRLPRQRTPTRGTTASTVLVRAGRWPAAVALTVQFVARAGTTRSRTAPAASVTPRADRPPVATVTAAPGT